MQATWSQPVAEVVVFSDDLARRRGGFEAAVGDLDAPGVPGGAEHRLLVVPADPADGITSHEVAKSTGLANSNTPAS